MNTERIIRSKAVVARAWDYIKADIEASDTDVAQKRVPFLSRLYHAIDKTVATIMGKVESQRIDPFADLTSTQYGPEIALAKFHSLDRPIRVGFFPIASNPLWWGHILVALMSQAALDLDTVVFRVQGEIRYKDLPETDRVPVLDRHKITKAILSKFYPLFRYTDLGSEPNNEREGADEMYRYLALNQETNLHMHYLLGVESEERVKRYLRQQYEAAREHKLADSLHHQLTIGWIQRGEYGAKITEEELDTLSALAQEAAGYQSRLRSALVRDRHIDLQVSSTYYRNTHDAAIVPSVIDEHARGHGFYGHPPIDPRTGKPYDYSEEEHFRIKLRPVTESIANQVVRMSERVGRGRTLVISIDGPSGSGKTTIGEEVTKFLALRGYEFVHVSFDIFMRSKRWRSAMETRILGQRLSDQEQALIGDMLDRTQPTNAYLDEEMFWDVEARKAFVQQIDRFRRSGEDLETLVVRNGYDRLTKRMRDFSFEIVGGMIIIIDGKYCNRDELASCYDIHYRLHDNPDRTQAKFEMRTRSLSPATADNQMRFYDVGLVPSYWAYARRTEGAIDWIIDLCRDDWKLVDPSQYDPAKIKQRVVHYHHPERAERRCTMTEEEALRLARHAIRQGDRLAGQRFLVQAIRANPKSEWAWLWLSAIVGDPAKERDCLNRVLAINPSNNRAQRRLTMLTQAQTPVQQSALPLSPAPQPSPASPPSTAPPPLLSPRNLAETEYLRDPRVLITDSRAVLGGKTYAMANIPSVTEASKSPNLSFAIVCLLVGGSMFLCSAGLLLSGLPTPRGESSEIIISAGAIGIGILFGGTIYSCGLARRRKVAYPRWGHHTPTTARSRRKDTPWTRAPQVDLQDKSLKPLSHRTN